MTQSLKICFDNVIFQRYPTYLFLDFLLNVNAVRAGLLKIVIRIQYLTIQPSNLYSKLRGKKKPLFLQGAEYSISNGYY